MRKESSTEGRELELYPLSLLGDEGCLGIYEGIGSLEKLQEPATSKCLWYSGMNFSEKTE